MNIERETWREKQERGTWRDEKIEQKARRIQKTWKDERGDNKENWGKYNFRQSEIGEKE